MEPLTERVLESVRRRALVPAGGTVLAAVSGGGDSVALARVLAELASAGHLLLAAIVHLNHGLRADASEGDERFCRELAAELGVDCVVDSVDVAAAAGAGRISVEQAGHRARHALFARVSRRFGGAPVALAHTMDDQAETVLLRLLRGAGPGGLAGMRPRRGAVIRPLLDVRRAELRVYLSAAGARFREDASNDDLGVPRNRVRHELVPRLTAVAPRAVEALAREAEIARLDEEFLAARANELAAVLVQGREGGLEIDAVGLREAHPALARRVVREALDQVSGRRSGFRQVERVRGVAAGDPSPVDLPGCRVEGRDGVVRLTRRAGRGVVPDVSFAYRLDVPGEVAVPEAGVSISAAPAAPPVEGPAEGVGRGSGVVTLSGVATGPLGVRSWRPGDRFRPIGLEGHRKKLQDLFVDRKIPRAARGRIPVVHDANGRILWVVGQGLSDDFRVTTGATSVLVLKVRPLGGTLELDDA